MIDCIDQSRLQNFVWTYKGWYGYQLEVRIWFWSSAVWPPTFLYLNFSTLYSSSLRRTQTIVFSKLNKPPASNVFETNTPAPLPGLIEELR